MLRTSGGRGEYELAGRHGDIHVADVANKNIDFQITPEILIPGRSRCVLGGTQGKPRIRLESKGRAGETHAYGFLRALLMLPEPIRELGETPPGDLRIENRAYSISTIKVDIVSNVAGQVVLRPTALKLENSAGISDAISVPERLVKVMKLWRGATDSISPLAHLVLEHRRIVLDEPHNHRSLILASEAIQRELNTTSDYVEIAAKAMGISFEEASAEATEEPETFTEEDDTTPLQSRLRLLKKWRRQIVRGPEARVFRRDVRDAYEHRCLFTGIRLPKISVIESPGVEAAHILPWSRYDINSVSNGLCLSKQCHWAFDNGILRLDYDTDVKSYVLSVPEVVRNVATREGLDLSLFDPHLGVIPSNRLPSAISFRPSPQYLDELNKTLFS